MLAVYPAIFRKAVEGGYVVFFPDFDNGATEGKTLNEAIEMAEDYMGTWLYDDFIKGRELPKATNINDIALEVKEDEKEYFVENESFKTLITLDIKKYVQECKSQTVRKNVSIPSWLNELAMNNNINFSKVLQEALKKELNVI